MKACHFVASSNAGLPGAVATSFRVVPHSPLWLEVVSSQEGGTSMVAAELIATAVLALANNVCPGPVWSDPDNDQLGFLYTPHFDLIGVSIHFEPDQLVLELSFDPTTASAADLTQLSGFVDFDADSNPMTGEPSHIDQFGLDPPMPMGVDYYVGFTPGEEMAELLTATAELEQSVGHFPIEIDGTTLKVSLPRCGPAPCSGIAVGARFQLSVLLGNYGEMTDRAPNGGIPYTAVPVRGDFDEDGDVDGRDFEHFSACISGPNIPQPAPACRNADLDGDGDIDQDDYGVFQVSITGACH
jgi:hypothetical protein